MRISPGGGRRIFGQAAAIAKRARRKTLRRRELKEL
jgi:hypothetical protein